MARRAGTVKVDGIMATAIVRELRRSPRTLHLPSSSSSSRPLMRLFSRHNIRPLPLRRLVNNSGRAITRLGTRQNSVKRNNKPESRWVDCSSTALNIGSHCLQAAEMTESALESLTTQLQSWKQVSILLLFHYRCKLTICTAPC